jgi:hypothetical protein
MPLDSVFFVDGREIAFEIELVVPPVKAGYLLPDFLGLHTLPLAAYFAHHYET